MKALYKKELAHFLNNPTGIIIVVVFALLANFIFVKDIFAQQSASMRPFFVVTAWLMTIFVPALAMRSFAAEKQNNTIETLLTIPIAERTIVLAKFMAVVTMVAISLALTLGLPLSLTSLAGLSLPEVLLGYIGLICVAKLFTAITFVIGLRSGSQMVAFFASAVVLFLGASFSSDFVASFIPRSIADSLSLFAPFSYFNTFIKGVLDIRAIVYFVSFTGFFLSVAVRELSQRN